MANIVSSIIVSAVTQKDGRKSVVEDHIDLIGQHWLRVYLAEANSDLNAALTLYAAICGDNLRDSEIAANISNIIANGRFAVTTLVYSTVGQNSAELRAGYQSASRSEAIFMADYLNTLTDNQIANAFNLTLQQVQNLRTNKLQPASSLADQIRATTGV